MQKTFLTISIFLALSTFIGCKKDDDDNNNNTACNGKNFCMKVDGVQFSNNVTWKIVPGGRRRIYWETGSGNSHRNIEIDIYDTTSASGSFNVVINPGAGQAGFQYFINDNGNIKDIEGESGVVMLASDANNQLTGTFTVTAKDQNNTIVNITEGIFKDVPKQ